MFRNSRILSVTLLVVMLGTSLLTACGGSKAGEIKIGSIAPLTGPIATYGQSHKNAVDLLAEQINAKGGVLGKTIVILHEDDQGDPVIGANAAQKLIEQDKVVAIVGPIPSRIGMAASPIAQSAGVPMVVTGTNPDITPGKSFVFRSCWTDDFQGLVMAKFAYEELGARTAGILYDLGNDYAKSVSEIFANTFKALGGSITTVETHPTDVTDFRAQLTNIKATSPDVFFFPDFYNDANLIGKQAREVGLTAQMLGADGWDSPDLDLATLDGAYYTSHFSKEDPRAETRAFVSDFAAKYGSEPDLLAIMGYDALLIVLDAIKRADSTEGAKIRDAMAATAGLAGAQGNISFDENGDPRTLPAAILQIKGGTTTYVMSFEP
jgi:branched-chain amino acid transport system substrate-binding protein